MKPRHLPNVISVVRLLLVGPVVWLLLTGRFGWALAVFLIAGVSDGLDGFLARHYGWHSRLGGLLDPLADKVLLVACFVVLGWLQLIPLWLVLAAVARDLLIMSGALVYNYHVEALRAAPIPASKLNTLLQILLVIAVIADAGPFAIDAAIIETLIWGCLGTILVSGIQYTWIWTRKALGKGWH